MEDPREGAQHREDVPPGVPSPHPNAMDAPALHCAGADSHLPVKHIFIVLELPVTLTFKHSLVSCVWCKSLCLHGITLVLAVQKHLLSSAAGVRDCVPRSGIISGGHVLCVPHVADFKGHNNVRDLQMERGGQEAASTASGRAGS